MSKSMIYLSTAGRPQDLDEAVIPAVDRGFLFGDSVFETMRTAGGRPVAWTAHLRRLCSSAAGLGFSIPWDDDELRAIVDRTHAATGNLDSVIRLVVTRGRGPMMLDPRRVADPLLAVYALPLHLPSADDYRRGLRARIVAAIRPPAAALDPALKTANYLPNIQALRQALAAGDDDAILQTAGGAIAEGATSNVFAVIAGRLRTPPVSEGILPGITRDAVLALAREHGPSPEETRILPDELRAADEVFLTSSVRGPIAVTVLDGRPVGAGQEGPVTAALRRRYDDALRAHSVAADMSEAT
jgi:branched-chain amino acid aminotransferase